MTRGPEVPLVVDASVALKWVLEEADSHLAKALALSEEVLLVPDLWLSEACNVLWLQVRRRVLTADGAHEGLRLLRAQIEPTPTVDLGLQEVALDIGIAVNHSTYDTMYLAFAIAMGAEQVIAADGPFVRAMQMHPERSIAGMVLPLQEWAKARGLLE